MCGHKIPADNRKAVMFWLVVSPTAAVELCQFSIMPVYYSTYTLLSFITDLAHIRLDFSDITIQ